MKTAKHTPGPWDLNTENPEEYIVETMSYGLIALVPVDTDHADQSGRRLEEIDRANAQLIAAAPELLLACKEACLILADLARAHGFNAENTASFRRFREIINKAEGWESEPVGPANTRANEQAIAGPYGREG